MDIILVIVVIATIGGGVWAWRRFLRAKGRCPIDGTVRCPHCAYGKERSDAVDVQMTTKDMGSGRERESDV